MASTGRWETFIAKVNATITPEQRALSWQNHDAYFTSIATILGALAIFFVTMRITFRYKENRRLQTDDWLCIAGLVIGIAYTIYKICEVNIYGTGLHIWAQTPALLEQATEYGIISDPFPWIAQAFAKCSVLVMYDRLFSAGRPGYRAVFIIVGVFTILDTLTYTILLFSECGPYLYILWADYQPVNHDDVCIPWETGYWVVSGVWLVCDLVMVLMPLPAVLRLHRDLKDRLGIAALFLLGLLCPTCSAIRLALQQRWYQEFDYTYYAPETWIWVVLEVHLTNIVVGLILSRAWIGKLNPARAFRVLASRAGRAGGASADRDHKSSTNKDIPLGAVRSAKSFAGSKAVVATIPMDSSSGSDVERQAGARPEGSGPEEATHREGTHPDPV